MKKLIVLVICMLPLGVWSQQIKPVKTIKSVSSSVSKPLRDMPIVISGEKISKEEHIEVPNMVSPLAKLKAQGVSSDDPVVQRSEGGLKTGLPIINIPGIGAISEVSPSDANGAVGLNHYIQTVNTAIAIWDKQGNLLLGPFNLSTLWEDFEGPWSESLSDGDPVVLYDHLADRWLVSQFSLPFFGEGPYYQLIAVSTSGDPSGSWYRYAFEFEDWNDYPKFNLWSNGYYSAQNMFRPDSTFELDDTPFLGGAIVVFNRDSMLSGAKEAEGVAFFSDSSEPNQFIMPTLANLDGPPPAETQPNPMLGIAFDENGVLGIYLWEVSVNWNQPEESFIGNPIPLDVAPYTIRTYDNGIPQPGHDYLLEVVHGERPNYPMQYRNFEDHQSLVAGFTVDVNGTTGIRWMEIRKEEEQWAIYQQGTYCPDSTNRWMSSLAMNGNGDIAMGYSAGGKNKWASIRYTGQRVGSHSGEMTYAEVEPVAGDVHDPYTSRWGDYCRMAVDPVDDETFWFTAQYAGGGPWASRILSFKLGETPEPSVFAGEDMTICSNEPFTTDGQVTNCLSMNWITTGDGRFIWNDGVSSQYRPGNHDIANEGVDLVLEAQGYLVGSFVSDTMHLTISNCTGVETFMLDENLLIMPNPTDGVFSIQMQDLPPQLLTIVIQDISGKIIFQQKREHPGGHMIQQFSLEEHPAGNYFLQIQGNQQVAVRQVIKSN